MLGLLHVITLTNQMQRKCIRDATNIMDICAREVHLDKGVNLHWLESQGSLGEGGHMGGGSQTIKLVWRNRPKLVIHDWKVSA